MIFDCKKHSLLFNHPVKTSRGVMYSHEINVIRLFRNDNSDVFGLGEAAPLPGLSPDYGIDFQDMAVLVQSVLKDIDVERFDPLTHDISVHLKNYPSWIFALETALCDLRHGGKRKIFDGPFYQSHRSLPINGLVWMNDKNNMLEEALQKIKEGYTTIKIKVGSLHFDEELEILEQIRKKFAHDNVILRLDANGAWAYEEALEKLNILKKYHIHSVEQPIKHGNVTQMAQLCKKSPIPIALDEELISVRDYDHKRELLENIKPAYLVLKPTLCGGLFHASQYIHLAQETRIGWWVTSALESNIALNALAQFCSIHTPDLPQGLGTGALYTNNFDSTLVLSNGLLSMKSTN